MLTMAAAQWIIGPYIDYQTEAEHFKYKMYVEELEYMQVVVPAFLAFVVGTLWATGKKVVDVQAIRALVMAQPQLPYWLIGIGIVATLAGALVPSALLFVFFLLSNLKYIGLGYLLLTDSKYKWHILAGALLFVLASSIRAGLFHDFILWSILLFFYVSFVKRFSITAKLLILGISFLFLFLLQSVKHEYRMLTWENEYKGDKIELFTSLVLNKLSGIDQAEENQVNDVNTRLNQGWIISLILQRYPEQEPFAEGETVIAAIEASALPRFLASDKRGGGGKETFERLTGLTLLGGTAMGVSLMGEFYGNYGPRGAIISFFVWGVLLNAVYNRFWKLQATLPSIMFWLPLVFLQVIKAESDLVTVLNHLIKSLILVALIIFGSKNFMKIKV